MIIGEVERGERSSGLQEEVGSCGRDAGAPPVVLELCSLDTAGEGAVATPLVDGTDVEVVAMVRFSPPEESGGNAAKEPIGEAWLEKCSKEAGTGSMVGGGRLAESSMDSVIELVSLIPEPCMPGI